MYNHYQARKVKRVIVEHQVFQEPPDFKVQTACQVYQEHLEPRVTVVYQVFQVFQDQRA